MLSSAKDIEASNNTTIPRSFVVITRDHTREIAPMARTRTKGRNHKRHKKHKRSDPYVPLVPFVVPSSSRTERWTSPRTDSNLNGQSNLGGRMSRFISLALLSLLFQK